MRAILVAGLLLATLLSGCVADTDSPVDSEPAADIAEDPYHVDETLDLSGGSVDQTWEWSMSPGMTGNVRIEFIPSPASAQGPNPICWRLEWPQGAHYGGQNCNGNVGNVGVSYDSSNLSGRTIYDNWLYPNDFTLRVWTRLPDTAQVAVVIDTYAAPEE